jgi:histidine ammonia-lyase
VANLGHILGIELLAAAQGCDFHQPLASSPALEAARSRLRAAVPMLDEDRYFGPDIELATAMIRAGEIVDAVGRPLPSLETAA